MLGTGWNKWCTEGRFQRNGPCRLGCDNRAEDRIEHYVCCPTIRQFHRSELRITDCNLLEGWLGIRPNMTDKERTLNAIGAYCSYRVFNLVKHSGALPKEEVIRAMQQYGRDAVARHPRAVKTLEQVWLRPTE